MKMPLSTSMKMRHATVKQQGKLDAEAGICKSACPYYSGDWANSWERGWIEGSVLFVERLPSTFFRGNCKPTFEFMSVPREITWAYHEISWAQKSLHEYGFSNRQTKVMLEKYYVSNPLYKDVIDKINDSAIRSQ